MAPNLPKLSIDLQPENRKILQKLKDDRGWPYGNTVNTLISTFCDVPDKVSQEMLNMIKVKLKELYDKMDRAEGFEAQALMRECEAYNNMATFFNKGYTVSVEAIEKTPTMKKIQIKDSYLVVPNDWIILNPEDAEDAYFAGVIEVRHHDKYGVPYMVVLLEEDDFQTFAKTREEWIYARCQSAWEGFKEILNMQVKPVEDPTSPGDLLNETEWAAAPNIYYYDIYVHGDRKFGKNYKPPFGAQIIRVVEDEYKEERNVWTF